ncbi:hypothetical protein CPB86DRAFT_715915, partial [Serendipita vermifera]
MSVGSHIPTEIWQTILRYAISVPVFLDPYAAENHSLAITWSPPLDWNIEASYWAAERTRNSLQRVCCSWDDYLRSFEHRYVRMSDVVHDLVPPTCLTNAIRISL